MRNSFAIAFLLLGIVSLPAAGAPILFSFSGVALRDGVETYSDVPHGTPVSGWVEFDPASFDGLATTDGSSVGFAGILQPFNSPNIGFLRSFSSGISTGNGFLLKRAPLYSVSLRLTDSDAGDGVLLRLSYRHPATGIGSATLPQYELTLDLSGGPEIFPGTNGLSGSIEDAISAIELLDLDQFSTASGRYLSWHPHYRIDFVVQNFRRVVPEPAAGSLLAMAVLLLFKRRKLGLAART